jgi:ankyrin repeat protein
MLRQVSGRERSVNKEQKSRLRRWFLLALLGLAGWLVFATWPRDLGEELRYAIFKEDEAKVRHLLRKHPELVNQTNTSSPSYQTLRNSHSQAPAMNFAEEFTLFLWKQIVMKPVKVEEDPDEHFRYIEAERLPPLQIAIEMNNLSLTKLLLENGADINQKSLSGLQAIYFAARQQPEITQLLLAQGVQPDNTNTYYPPPLQVAVHNTDTTTLKLLLEAGADPNAYSRGGWTALHVAVMKTGDTKALELLLQYGARPDLTNRQGKTALDMALEYHRSEAAEILARKQGNRQTIP